MAADMIDWSRSETIALGARAALGAGIPAGQAMLYAQAAALYLGEGGTETLPSAALERPEETTRWLTAYLMLPAGAFAVPDCPLRRAALRSLPGFVNLSGAGEGHYAPDLPAEPARLPRPKLPAALESIWKTYAARTYVPESDISRAGAGAADQS